MNARLAAVYGHLESLAAKADELAAIRTVLDRCRRDLYPDSTGPNRPETDEEVIVRLAGLACRETILPHGSVGCAACEKPIALRSGTIEHPVDWCQCTPERRADVLACVRPTEPR